MFRFYFSVKKEFYTYSLCIKLDLAGIEPTLKRYKHFVLPLYDRSLIHVLGTSEKRDFIFIFQRAYWGSNPGPKIRSL